jgi:putative ABC transport system permease protein
LEAFAVGLIGGVTGYLLGLGISHLFGPVITGIRGGGIFVDPVLALGVIFLSVTMGILSSIYPAIHASKMDPTAALRAL